MELLDRFNRDVNERKTVFIVCDCNIEYWGRSRSIIDHGDRLVLVKPDTTLLVHSLKGFKPVNWMSSPTDTVMELEDGKPVIYSQRTQTPYEEMKIKVNQVTDYRSYSSLRDDSSLELTHTEKDMQEYLASNPQLIHEDFKLKSREYKSPLGLFDLYGRIGDKYAIVELKADKAGLPAALQIKRYCDWLRRHLKQEVEGILVAPGITPNALNILRKEGMEFIKFSLERIPDRKDRTKKRTLDEWVK